MGLREPKQDRKGRWRRCRAGHVAGGGVKSGKERALEGAEIHGFTFLLCSLNLLWYFKFYYLMF